MCLAVELLFSDKRVGSIVGDLEIIEVLAEKLKCEVHFFCVYCNLLSSFLSLLSNA